MRTGTKLGAATLAAGMLLAAAAHAATYYVDVNYDGANGTPDGTETRPYTTITAGVAAAEAVSGTHVVLIADGTYRSLLSLGNENFGAEGLVFTRTLTVSGGYVGQVSAGDFDWTEVSRTPRSTIIDLTGAGTRAFSTTGNATFDGLTIRNASHAKEGGAILRTGGHAQGVTIRNCLFANNIVAGNDGGAVSAHGRYAAVLIEDCDFMDNGARRGGAARVRGSPSTDTRVPLTIRRCTFADNHSTEYGGALEVPEGGPLTIEDCVFSGNEAGTHSGALLWASVGHAFTARRSIFAGNGSASGAAAVGTISRPTTYENCLFHGNAGPYTIEVTGGGLTVLHCTLAGNPNTVSALRVTQPLTVKNSIIVSNGLRGIQRTGTQLVDVDYNNVWGHSAGDYDGLSAGGNDISADPLFADAAGGDYRLAKGSPCVDAGTNLGVALDLSGIPRPTRAGFDMGAYEEWQIPIIANRAAVAQPTVAEARAEFTYESADIATHAFFVIDTADQGTNSLAAWWQSDDSGEQTQGVIFGHTFSGLSPNTTYFYRCMASNSYDVMWGPLASFKTPASGGATRLWTGLGGTALASTADNWLDGVAPSAGDYIVLDGSSSNLTWNAAAPQTVGNWTQTENYKGTVTFETTYPAYNTAFTNFAVTGDATVAGGTWTHLGHSSTPIKQNSDATRRYRLRVTVGGDLTVGAPAKIDLFGRGLVNDGISETIRGTLGGQRSNESQAALPLSDRTTKGSITAPEDVGRGGDWGNPNDRFGGGAVWLTVDGASVIDGEILARAGTWNSPANSPRHGSGGSIWLQTGTLAGSGLIDASNGDSGAYGGGGRVAVVVTNDTSFGNVRMRAYGGGSGPAAAGTVYKEHAGHGAGQGILVLDNNNQTHANYGQPYYAYGVTLMPDAANGGPVNLNAFAEVIVTNRAILGINTDTALDWSTANLHLHNRNQSFIAIRGTNNVVWPASFTVDGFTLLLDVDPNAAGNWTVTSGGRIARTFARQSTIRQLLNSYPLVPPLTLTLTGDLTVESGGEVTVQRMGYYSDAGPGRQADNRAASHGGQGGSSDGTGGNPVYGSILFPATSGSGGSWGTDNFSPAGGRMRLTVTGTTTLDGELNAMPDTAKQERASGGSVWLTTGYLTGSTGAINARGRDGALGGGGGRIAVYLTHGTGTGSVTLDARGGYHATNPGAAGTVYVQKPSDPAGGGRIAVWNQGRVQYNRAATPLTPAQALTSDLPPVYGAFGDDLTGAILDISANGRVKLTGNLTVKDVVITTGGYLETAGHTLSVDALEHHLDDPSKRGMGDTAMVDIYANIVWIGKNPGTLILLR